MLEDEDAELPGFQEWFYFDYVLQSEERIIDLFVKEIGPQLAGAQRKMLEDWLATNRLHLLETQSVEPGIGETMQDLLSGEVFHMNDISFSYRATRWSIALLRPLLTEGRWNFTGSGILLTPLEKPHLLETAKKFWAAFQEKHPQASLLEFYRDYSLDLLQAANDIAEERRKPKALMTGEGHRAISSKADFIIKRNPREVENALDDAEEFVFENE